MCLKLLLLAVDVVQCIVCSCSFLSCCGFFFQGIVVVVSTVPGKETKIFERMCWRLNSELLGHNSSVLYASSH